LLDGARFDSQGVTWATAFAPAFRLEEGGGRYGAYSDVTESTLHLSISACST